MTTRRELRVARVAIVILALVLMALAPIESVRIDQLVVPTMEQQQPPPANASYTPCADHKTCDECLAASYTCHFCESDFQCHTIGSPSGCLVGISTCHHLEGASLEAAMRQRTCGRETHIVLLLAHV